MSNHAADIEALLHADEPLGAAIAELDVAALTWKPTPSAWSVTEVLVHLADHLIVVSFRIREILSGSSVRLPAFSQDPWVEGQYGNEAEAADVLAGYRALLAYNARLLRRLSPADWAKEAVNAKGERVSLADVVRGFNAHVLRHVGQIERIKAGVAAAEQRGGALPEREGA
ncbi:DinB family protein [Cohnella sp. 56]|uniref:DinB family protein n=1 Tax=Cohnella sp. 56 TaxID=3113722 RepID=UPI0030E7E677